MNNEEIKRQIQSKYDTEAQERDNEEWLLQGNSPRVPENKASQYFIARKVQEALKYCPFQRNARVMEIGCSFGHMTTLLAQYFDHLVAVDLSSKCVEIARKRLHFYQMKNVDFKVDDAEVLASIEDNAFDAIFSFSTIRYCPDPQKAIHQIYQKLAPNGVAIIDFPNRLSPWHIFIKSVANIRKHEYDNLYSPKDVVPLFRKTGFTNVQYKYFLFTTRRLPTVLLPLFRLIDLFFERMPFIRMFAGIIMVKGTK